MIDRYILVIDDDPTVEIILSQAIKNFVLVPAYSLAEARSRMESYSFSAIFFDIELPDGDGLGLLAEVTHKKFFNSIPIFVLSSHSEMPNKLMAFSLGVDDFIGKPFSPIEVQARLQAKLGRFQAMNQNQMHVKIGDVLVDLEKRAVYLLDEQGTETNLSFTHYEFMIFALLVKNMGKTFSRDEVLTEVWGDTTVSSRGVDSHIARVRSKLADSNVKINTVKGEGYSVLVEYRK
jgi:two-component system alkaline phosphatase synthesis response regulator PhoP